MVLLNGRRNIVDSTDPMSSSSLSPPQKRLPSPYPPPQKRAPSPYPPP